MKNIFTKPVALPKYIYPYHIMLMTPEVARVMEAATAGGYTITPAALAAAIRAAIFETREESGQPSIQSLYQFTYELESKRNQS